MSDILLAHFVGDVFRLPDGQRDDRQSWIFGAAGGELAAVGDEQVLDIVSSGRTCCRRRRAGSPSSGRCRDCGLRDRAGSGKSWWRRPPRRLRCPPCRRGCAWRCRSDDRRNARWPPAGPICPWRSGSRVTRLVSCGMSSPTSHMPAMFS